MKKAAMYCHFKNISNVSIKAAESWVNREIKKDFL
jgi:hypothetical protein